MSDIKDLIKIILKFRDERDWKQFHNPKDMAISLSLEAAEVLEHFQWKSNKEIEDYLITSKNHVAEELADVFYWTLLMSNDFGINIKEALEKKMKITDKKYPVEKAKGSHKKYTEL